MKMSPKDPKDIIMPPITTEARMPPIIATIELVLCFTTSASEDAFIFGNFKLVISPNTAEIEGAIKQVRNNAIISSKDTLNWLQKMMLQITITGTVIKSLIKTLAIKNFSTFTGKLLDIAKLLPSREIDEEVIDSDEEIKWT